MNQVAATKPDDLLPASLICAEAHPQTDSHPHPLL